MRNSPPSTTRSSESRCASPVRLSLGLAGAVLLAACGDSLPPMVCETLEDQTMHVRDDRFITPCFEDPEMELLTLGVISSAPRIVTAEVLGYGVSITAIGTGNATVTVTATDPHQQSASASFIVHVPNRPPWRAGRIRDMRLLPGNSSFVQVSRYFTDPDDQPLRYDVASSDTTTMSVSLLLQTATVVAHAEGSSVLTVTATDPHGEAASQEAVVTVTDPVDVFRDDFTTEASISDWELTSYSDATVGGGSLRLYNVVAGRIGWIETEVAAAPWEASVSMGNETDSVYVGLVAGIDHRRYVAYLIQVGKDDETFVDEFGPTDYRFFVFDIARETWFYADGWYGESDEVAPVGGLTEVTMAVQGWDLTVRIGSEEVLRMDLVDRGMSDELTYLALASWPKCCETGHAGVVDWVHLRGGPVNGASAAGSGAGAHMVGRLPATGLREAMRSMNVRAFDRDEQVSSASGNR